MTKALVLGASGSMGYAITKELLNHEIQVTAFARSQSKLERLFQDQANVTIVAGDAFHIDKLREASQNIYIIYHSLGIPYYEWKDRRAFPKATSHEKGADSFQTGTNHQAIGGSQPDCSHSRFLWSIRGKFAVARNVSKSDSESKNHLRRKSEHSKRVYLYP